MTIQRCTWTGDVELFPNKGLSIGFLKNPGRKFGYTYIKKYFLRPAALANGFQLLAGILQWILQYIPKHLMTTPRR